MLENSLIDIRFVTGRVVVQHSVNGRISSQWRRANFSTYRIEPSESIANTFVTVVTWSYL